MLKDTDLEDVLKIECQNVAYDSFLDKYLAAFDKSFPLRERTFIQKYVKREPWFTSGLLISSINKSRLFSLKIHKPTQENILKYKCYNKLYNKLTWTIELLLMRIKIIQNNISRYLKKLYVGSMINPPTLKHFLLILNL